MKEKLIPLDARSHIWLRSERTWRSTEKDIGIGLRFAFHRLGYTQKDYDREAKRFRLARTSSFEINLVFLVWKLTFLLSMEGLPE